jgi:hypothetical protein
VQPRDSMSRMKDLAILGDLPCLASLAVILTHRIVAAA